MQDPIAGDDQVTTLNDDLVINSNRDPACLRINISYALNAQRSYRMRTAVISVTVSTMIGGV